MLASPSTPASFMAEVEGLTNDLDTLLVGWMASRAVPTYHVPRDGKTGLAPVLKPLNRSLFDIPKTFSKYRSMTESAWQAPETEWKARKLYEATLEKLSGDAESISQGFTSASSRDEPFAEENKKEADSVCMLLESATRTNITSMRRLTKIQGGKLGSGRTVFKLLMLPVDEVLKRMEDTTRPKPEPGFSAGTSVSKPATEPVRTVALTAEDAMKQYMSKLGQGQGGWEVHPEKESSIGLFCV